MAVEKLIEDFDWPKTAGHASAEHVYGERVLLLKSGAGFWSAGHQGGLAISISARWPVILERSEKKFVFTAIRAAIV